MHLPRASKPVSADEQAFSVRSMKVWHRPKRKHTFLAGGVCRTGVVHQQSGTI